MTLTIADIERWDAGDVREVFHAANSRAQALQDAADGMATLPAFTTWGGEAAEAAREAIGRTRKDLDAHGHEALAVADAARSAAGDIERITSDLATLKADAAALGMEIDPSSGRVVAAPGFAGDTMELLLKQRQLQPRVDTLVAQANAVDDLLAEAIEMADGTTPVPDSPHSNDPEIQAALGRPLPTDPDEFHDLWQKLTGEQKDWLFGQNHAVGNQPGMPFEDKNFYGTRYLDELQQATQLRVDGLQARVDDLMGKVYQGDHSSATTGELDALAPQLMSARHQLDGYRALRGALEARGGVPRYLAFIDDQGHAAVSIGNPDNATRTATFVPGTGQDLAAFEGSDRKSWDMFQAGLVANLRLTKDDLAVTTWMGYDRPMDLTEAAFPGRAEKGGAALDLFVQGMHASHQGPAAVDTVIGHSYGSTLVGGASSGDNHLPVDNVIAVGSPGMIADAASDLNLDQGATVYSMRARNDVIGLVPELTLGADPFGSEYGATRLWTDPGPSLPNSGGLLPTVTAHSSYWDAGNPGLANMGAIIAGLPPNKIILPDGMVQAP